MTINIGNSVKDQSLKCSSIYENFYKNLTTLKSNMDEVTNKYIGGAGPTYPELYKIATDMWRTAYEAGRQNGKGVVEDKSGPWFPDFYGQLSKFVDEKITPPSN